MSNQSMHFFKNSSTAEAINTIINKCMRLEQKGQLEIALQLIQRLVKTQPYSKAARGHLGRISQKYKTKKQPPV